MITKCNCPEEKNCAGHLTLQEQKLLYTSAQFMNRNVDDDIVAITYSKASLESILKEVSSSSPPSSDNFTVVLGAQPTADVTVNFVSSDTT